MSDKEQGKPTATTELISADSDQGFLSELLREAKAKREPGFGYPTLERFEQSEITEKLSIALGSLGIRNKLGVVGIGSYAITFTTANNQLIRITDEQLEGSDIRSLPPTVLRPLKSYYLEQFSPALKGIRLDVMPVVKVGHEARITRADIFQLIKDTGHYQHVFWDVDESNIGRLSDGTPIIIDLGSVEPFISAMKTEKFTSARLITYLSAEANHPSMPLEAEILQILRDYSSRPLSTDYVEAQRKHLAAMNLEEGGLNGLITKDDIMRLRKFLITSDRDSVITDAMLRGRHDMKSWDHLMDEAVKIAEKDGGEAWRDFIRTQSEIRATLITKP